MVLDGENKARVGCGYLGRWRAGALTRNVNGGEAMGWASRCQTSFVAVLLSVRALTCRKSESRQSDCGIAWRLVVVARAR